MSDGQVKKYSARSYCLECPALFGNRTSKNLGVLVHRTSEHFKIFFTPDSASRLSKRPGSLWNCLCGHTL